MKKLLTLVLTFSLYFSPVSTQDLTGNYQIDSLVVTYVMVTRDMVQQLADGTPHIIEADDSLASYSLAVGWPLAGDSSEIDIALPVFAPGDTIRVQNVALPSAAWLAAAGIAMNVDFTNGTYTFNEGSTYPTTQTVNCVTVPTNPAIQDYGTWTDGGYDPLVDATNFTSKTGWGILTSGVFASFEAPDMVNHVYGTDYGVGTAMPDWGYIQTNYSDGTFSAPTGLNIGWEAHDGPNSGIGIVDAGDNYYNEAEAGLLNNVVGLQFLPADSVTIAATAAVAAGAGITINVPAEHPYMFLGPGLAVNPATGEAAEGYGAFPNGSDRGYVFDPTGSLLGGDDVPFNGDEALAATGYFWTWNTLVTLNSIAEGAGAAIAAGCCLDASGNPLPIPNVPMLADSVIDYVMYYWDVAEAYQLAASANIKAGLVTQIGQWVLAGVSFQDALSYWLPWVLGALAQAEAGGGFVDSDGTALVVNDSDHDLDPESWVSYEYWGDYPTGGRMFVQMYANCVPAKWSQYIDSHWNYTGAVSSVDGDGIVADRFELKGNYPNPFNPTTKIRFSNDRTANVTVNVYSLRGERVASILNTQLNSGTYEVSWNGMSKNGTVVPSGMYLYEVNSEGRRLQGKMLLLK